MKLIIDIPEEVYKASQIVDVKYEDVVQIPLEAIATGIPLEQIKAKISEKAWLIALSNTLRANGMWDAYKIIEKYTEDNR